MIPEYLRNQGQGLVLGLGRDGAATVAKVLQGIPQRHTILEDVNILASQLGLVDDILLAGTSIMASDKGCDINMFHPECYAEGMRSVGLAMPKALAVTVKATLAANGTIAAWVGGQPLPPLGPNQSPPDPSEAAAGLGYAFGLGSVSVDAAGAAVRELTARATRNVTLGGMFLTATSNGLDVVIEYVKINSRPLLIGRGDSTIDACGISAFSHLATDADGRVLAQDVEVGDTVTVGLRNYNGAAIVCYGGIFCIDDDDDDDNG